jgi:hypothetical protein
MDIDKLLKKFKKYAEQEWSDGWDAGYESARGNSDDLGTYRDMLSFRMSLIYDSAIKDNKFREAKIYKEIIEYLELDLIDDPYNSVEVK